jgi:hypothetical protein
MAIIEKKIYAQTKDKLDEEVKRYFEHWHPSGYCTLEHERGELVDNNGDLFYYCKVSRLSSCN